MMKVIVELDIHKNNPYCNRCRFIEYMDTQDADWCNAFNESLERKDGMRVRCSSCINKSIGDFSSAFSGLLSEHEKEYIISLRDRLIEDTEGFSFLDIDKYFLRALMPFIAGCINSQPKEEKSVKVATSVDYTEKFTVYWLDGKLDILEGTDIKDALTKAGYGGGAAQAIDFFSKGDPDPKYWWDEENTTWTSRDKTFGQLIKEAAMSPADKK